MIKRNSYDVSLLISLHKIVVSVCNMADTNAEVTRFFVFKTRNATD